ncbi:MAG: FAD-dependent oxidoreductase, partial [Candidatus Gastranaerophilaceae bacterium]
MKIVIVGGGAAGASCAARLRRLNEEAEILIIEKSNEVSIANCGLPYYVSDVINEREKILVSTPEKFKSWFNIDVLLNTEAVKINRDTKTITLNNDAEIKYDKLVLAQGASPIVPAFEGLNKEKTFVVRNLSDADKIKDYIQQNNSKNAVVIGGGFIGIEMAENLVETGINTTLVELGKQVLAPVDEEIAAVVQNEMRDNGVNLVLSDGVKSFNNNKIILNSGRELDFDIVIMAIGVKPETELAKAAGLNVNRGIVVNDYMQTSDEYIYAAGDSVEIKDFVTDDSTLIPLAGPANRQGRIIADNICDIKSTYKNSQGTSVLKVFNITAASVGNNEKQLKQKNISYWKTFVYGNSHAGYYPNATQTLYKLLFTNEGKILGAQAVGQEGVEKRIDVISSVMRNGGTIQELTDSELCYAPPYNSAKDAGVNILGMNADNILKGLVKPAYFEDLENAYLIDVRANIAYTTKTINGAVNIPIDEIRSRIDEFPKDKKVILFCNTGYTSYNASRILMQKGFNNVYSLMGGINLYKEIIKNKEEKVTEKVPVIVGTSLQNSNVTKIDACGLQCPGPVMKVAKALENADEGEIFEVTSTDRGFKSDIGAWCES